MRTASRSDFAYATNFERFASAASADACSSAFNSAFLRPMSASHARCLLRKLVPCGRPSEARRRAASSCTASTFETRFSFAGLSPSGSEGRPTGRNDGASTLGVSIAGPVGAELGSGRLQSITPL